MKKLGLIFLFLLIINVGFAADVAYILKNPNNPDNNLLNVLTQKGFTIELIDDSLVSTTNFSTYKLLVVGDELFSNAAQIPVNTYPSLILNSYHVDEWGWTDKISALSSNMPLQVINNNLTSSAAYVSRDVPQVMNIYTACCYSGGSISLPLYYFDRLDSALSLLVVSSTTQNQYNRASTITLPGNNLLNGKKSYARGCFFGATESVYWTDDAKTLLADCADWVAYGADKDNDGYYETEDCNDNDPSIHPNAVELDDGIDQDCIDDPPVLSDMPNVTFNEDLSNSSVDLDYYVTDLDNADSSLLWTYLGNVNVKINLNNSTHVVNFSANPNFYGQETINFSVKDPKNLSDSKNIIVNVLPVNDAPILNPISNVNAFATSLISVTAVASDVENDSLTYSINDSRFMQNNNTFAWQTDVNGVGSYAFTITVSDGYLQASRTFNVTISPKILINEFTSDPFADRTNDTFVTPEDEFIELYNPANMQVSFLNYQLIMNDSSSTTQSISGTIPANSHLTIYDPTGSLDDNGQISLKNQFSQIIDNVTYGNYNDGNMLNNAPNGTSISLNDECVARYPDGTDTNTDINDFIKKSCNPSTNNNLDVVNPVVSLISPANNTFDNDGDITFMFNATNQQLTSCSLLINSNVNQTKDASGSYVEDSFSLLDIADNTILTWTVQCSDDANNIGTAPSRVITVRVNDAPTLTQIPNQTITEDVISSINLNLYSSDPENDSLTYSVTAQDASKVTCSVVGSTLSLMPSANFNGISSCTIIANDSSLSSNQVTFNINVLAANDDPTLTQNIPDQTWNEDNNLTINLSNYFQDLDNDVLAFTVLTSPNNITVSIASSIATLIPDANFNGITAIAFTASDSSSSVNSNLVQLTVQSVNDAPIITSTPNPNATEDLLYQTDVDAFDPDNDTVSYSLITAPANMTIDLASGLISWTPINSQVGINQVTVQASDNNLTSLQLFTITVANTNDDPTLTQNIPDQTWNEDNNLTINLSNYFQDLDNDVLAFTVLTSPNNITVSIASSIATLIPDANFNGITAIAFTASDSSSSVNSNLIQLTVQSVNDAPIITSTPNPNATEDLLYQTDVDAFDPDNDTVSYSLITAPANMTIDLASGLISWTPINSQVGINQVTVQASDNNLTSLQLFTITVANTNDDPTLTQNIPDQTWNEDNNLTINLSNYF